MFGTFELRRVALRTSELYVRRVIARFILFRAAWMDQAYVSEIYRYLDYD